MLSASARPVIEATLPLVGSRIGSITPLFYSKLFAAHPELLNGTFSRANQRNGAQQQALAGSIATFATHLVEHPDTLPETMLSRIAHKHASLGITEEQYQVVYQFLFEAIAEDLAEVITPEIAQAWTEVYWLMAHALIKLEKGLYERRLNDVMWSPWTLAERTQLGPDTVRLTFTPADATAVTPGEPGGYLSVRTAVADGLLQARQYTLSGDAASVTHRTITVKRDADGEVSPQLHDALAVGDTVELSNPYGDIVLEETDRPLVLATAGIGSTPSASILHALADSGSEREVLVLHADQSPESWSLREQMLADLARLPKASLQLWYENPGDDAAALPGFMDLSAVRIPQDASVLLCGPTPFMKAARSAAIEQGVSAERVHYEIFGPDVWLASA
ncbi:MULTISPECIES: globin domain-containing protein [Arthrobacter]|uniref:nitric oxide dioxygenase n=2 Tax=Arthrobacter TaxID=1663 RepID=A0ABU9KHS3_9MICC|nr:globin domain-containing protein [Arthrobacter sp. YJM1]MDP5226662.1 FAD-binding oxidoreductase [Arthrobacter sp. YJM1]